MTLPIFSLNYEFMAQNLEGGKHLWVDTAHTLSDEELGRWLGRPVRLISSSSNLNVPSGIFSVDSIFGTRLVLLPANPQIAMSGPRGHGRFGNPELRYSRDTRMWHPLTHSGNWGYSTRSYDIGNRGTIPPHHQDRNHNYGSGCPVAFLMAL